MSYTTKVDLLIPGKGAHRPAGVEALLDELGIDHDVVGDLDQIFATGSGTLKLPPSKVDDIMAWVSRQEPDTRYVIRVKGKDEDVASMREFVEGVAAVSTYKPPVTRKSPKAAKAAKAIAVIGDAPAYSPKESYAVGDAMDHPSFGKGLVTQAQETKVLVQFADVERTLIHRRG